LIDAACGAADVHGLGLPIPNPVNWLGSPPRALTGRGGEENLSLQSETSQGDLTSLSFSILLKQLASE